jgi:uncharacterized protein YbjT (DUF2867 family)
MRIAIAGGHGQIALRLSQLLSRRGDEVLSLIRNPAHSADVEERGARAVVCDLESASEDEVAAAVAGADAVVFAAGAGPGSGAERKQTMDYGGAVKLMAAAKRADIDRYVIVSSIGADPDAPGDDVFAIYLRAKGQADAALRDSGLGYTIVRPGGLTNDAGTGRVQLGEDLDSGRIPRDDVAAVLAEVLIAPHAVGKSFDLVSGDVPVEAAVEAV